MSFLSASRLWLLLVPVALAAAYVIAQLSRRRYAVRFTNVELMASVAPKRPGWRRHVPAGVLLASLLALAVGFARPVIDQRVPRERASVMLAVDVSTSMAADDVAPTRLVAAENAARQFVSDLPEPLRLGLVTFAGSARVVVPPTTERAAVLRGIDQLTLEPRTAIGEAIFTSLDALSADTLQGDGETPAVIILMSDGTTTTGRSDAAASAAAKSASVPVTTIAYGTDEGTVDVDGREVPVPVDRAALEKIATDTGGKFFEAADAGQLREAYSSIGRSVGYETEQREVTALFTGLGMLLVVGAAAGSLVWMARLP